MKPLLFLSLMSAFAVNAADPPKATPEFDLEGEVEKEEALEKANSPEAMAKTVNDSYMKCVKIFQDMEGKHNVYETEKVTTIVPTPFGNLPRSTTVKKKGAKSLGVLAVAKVVNTGDKKEITLVNKARQIMQVVEVDLHTVELTLDGETTEFEVNISRSCNLDFVTEGVERAKAEDEDVIQVHYVGKGADAEVYMVNALLDHLNGESWGPCPDGKNHRHAPVHVLEVLKKADEKAEDKAASEPEVKELAPVVDLGSESKSEKKNKRRGRKNRNKNK